MAVHDVSVPTSTYRAMQGLIAILVSSAVGMSGWSLITLNSLSARLSSVEAKLISDAAYHDKTIDRIEATVEKSVERLETKIDKLAEAVTNRNKQ